MTGGTTQAIFPPAAAVLQAVAVAVGGFRGLIVLSLVSAAVVVVGVVLLWRPPGSRSRRWWRSASAGRCGSMRSADGSTRRPWPWAPPRSRGCCGLASAAFRAVGGGASRGRRRHAARRGDAARAWPAAGHLVSRAGMAAQRRGRCRSADAAGARGGDRRLVVRTSRGRAPAARRPPAAGGAARHRRAEPGTAGAARR